MAKQLFANNARSTLAAGINNSVTSLTVSTGEGALFPSPTGGDWFLATLALRPVGVTETAWEIVKVTARSGDALTIVRAQEGTTALSWSSGTLIELRATAGTLEALQVVSASTSASGISELATSTEAVAGTDTAKVTPVSAQRQAFLSWLRDAVGEFAGIIQPAFNFFAPNLAFPATASLTRASSGWTLSQAPAVKPYTTNIPRYSYDENGNLLGLRIENASTRINTIAAAPTAAEDITVTAVAHTISFYGTGSVVLSGAHSATVTGAGAFPARTSLTFTPSAGTLTLTPSGDVQHLQVEVGDMTTPILGEGTAITRAADVCTTALSGIVFNVSEGTVFVDAVTPAGYANFPKCISLYKDTNNAIYVDRQGIGIVRCMVVTGGTTVSQLNLGVVAHNTRFRVAFSWKADDFKASLNGGTPVTGTSGAIPTGLTTLAVGSTPATAATNWNSSIRHLTYFPRALTTAQLQAITL